MKMKFRTVLIVLLAAGTTLFAAGCGKDGNTSGSAEKDGMISDARDHSRDVISDIVSRAESIVSDIVSGAESFLTPSGSDEESVNPPGTPSEPPQNASDTSIVPAK